MPARHDPTCIYCWRPVSEHGTLFDCVLWKREMPLGGVLFILRPYVKTAYTWPG